MAMESTPDSGVEIKNAVVAPLLAPCFLSDAAAGSTPQDHNGMGIPSRAALNMDEKRPRPRCRETAWGLKKTLRSPATKIPNSMYMDASWSKSQDSLMISITIFISKNS